MGIGRIRHHRDDHNNQRKRTGDTASTQTIRTIQNTFCSRTKQTSQQGQFLQHKKNNESAPEVQKRLFEIEKNCEFEDITPAELLASKFLSLIGNSSGDYELKKKIKKSNMSIDAITDAIYEQRYGTMNETTKTDETNEVRHIKERTRRAKTEDKKNIKVQTKKRKLPQMRKPQVDPRTHTRLSRKV